MTTKRLEDDSIVISNSNAGIPPSESTIPILSSAPQNTQALKNMPSTLILNDKNYKVVRELARSGEAEVYLLESEGNSTVLKLYYPQYKPKDEILKTLKGLQHPDIISLIDYGYYMSRFFELCEYAKGGSLLDIIPTKDINNLRNIVSETVNALEFCHSHGIIHRDIKPENIFYKKANKSDIVIGDFGISSALEGNFSRRFTSQARTTVYAAPEVFQNIKGKTVLGKEVDYYSLGMTLLHIWSGTQPFEDQSEYAIMRLKNDGKVLIPEDLPQEWKNLIKGLITVEPPKRWGYDHVQRWLKGETVEVCYKTISVTYKDFIFGNIDGQQEVVSSPIEMASALEREPTLGKKHLYKLTIANWVKDVNPALYIEMMSIVEDDFTHDQDAGLTKAIYVLDPEKPFKGIDGTLLYSSEEIGDYFENNFDKYIIEFKKSNADFYLFLEARNFKKQADEFRSIVKNLCAEAALNTIILYLQGGDAFKINNLKFYHPSELLKSTFEFEEKLAEYLANINSKFSIWMTEFTEYSQNIEKWRKSKVYNQATLKFALGCGFELNAHIVNNESEFRILFKDQIKLFFGQDNTHDKNIQRSQNRQNAHYWLEYYASSSFPTIVYDFWLNEDYDANCYEQMLSYIVENFHLIKHVTIFDLLDSSSKRLYYFKNLGRDFQDETLIISKCIEECWSSANMNVNGFARNSLIPFIDYVTSKQELAQPFLSNLFKRLDFTIIIEIHKDLDIIIRANIESASKDYWYLLFKLLPNVKSICQDSHFVRFIENSQHLIDAKTEFIKMHNDIDCKDKTMRVDEEYERLLELKYQEVGEIGPLIAKYTPPSVMFAIGLIVFIYMWVGGEKSFGVVFIYFCIFLAWCCIKISNYYNVISLSPSELAAQKKSYESIREYYINKLNFELNSSIYDIMITSASDLLKLPKCSDK